MNTKFKALASALLLVFVSGGASAFKPNKSDYGHQMILNSLLSQKGYSYNGYDVPQYLIGGIGFTDEAAREITDGVNSRDWFAWSDANPLPKGGNTIIAENGSGTDRVDCYIRQGGGDDFSNLCSYRNGIYITGDLFNGDAHFDNDGFTHGADAIYKLIRGKPDWENISQLIMDSDQYGPRTSYLYISYAGMSVVDLLKKYISVVPAGVSPVNQEQRNTLTVARIKLGKAIHTLHDFYAHSTWADSHLENRDELFLPITANLLNPTSAPVFPDGMLADGERDQSGAVIAKRLHEDTCAAVVFDAAKTFTGGNWTITTSALTTGAFSSAGNGGDSVNRIGYAADSPPGEVRCDHGSDVNLALTEYTAGIAKDGPEWPPKGGATKAQWTGEAAAPSKQHLVASYQAAKHTAILLDTVVQIIRSDPTVSQTDADRMIAALLGADEPPPRIALVVDTSGSMGTIVQGISAAIGDLSVPVNGLTVHTYYADSVYATASSDRQKIQSLLAMGGKGGAGCQPMAMAVLESVIQSLPRKSVIYFFSDATSSDVDKLESVKAAANERDVKINPVVMGACGKDGYQTEAQFTILANYTRGSVSYVLPDRVPVREAVKSLLRTESVLNQARSLRDLSGVSTRAAVDTTVIYTPGSPVLTEIGMVNPTQTVDIAVDGGLAQVLVTLSAPGAQASLVDAAGQAVALADSGSGLLFAAVNNPTAGTWRLVMTAPAPTPYQVQVEAQGGVALKNLDYAALLEVGPRSGHEYAPSLGSRPPSGASKASLTIEGVAGDSLSLNYVNQNGSVIASYPTSRASAVAFSGKVTVPASAYWVKVSGQSERGGNFVRMWRGEHSLPSPMPGGRIVVDAPERIALAAGSAAKLAVRLSNVGADENLTLTARSSLGAVTVTPSTLILPANTASSADLGFFVPAGATAGDLVFTLTSSTGARDVPLLISILIAAIKPICTLSAAPSSIAAGASSTLTAACTGAPTSYVWTGGTCAGTSSGTCTVTPSATTIYTVAGVNAGGTGSAASGTVTVTSTPPVPGGKTYADNGDGTVTDPTTGLVWMRCAMGQTWTGSTCSGTATAYTWDQAVALTNKATFAGKSDWRLPNIRELQTIVDRAMVKRPTLDTTAFPNAPVSVFWSGSTYLPNPGGAWIVDFYNGFNNANYKTDTNVVRLVRSGQSFGLLDIARPSADYVDHGDGTATHSPTSLIWQRCAVGQTWTGGTCAGAASAVTWDDAMRLNSGLGGKTDWRLPTEDELLSLVDYSKSLPAINSALFPNVPQAGFWSGSSYSPDPNVAWFVDFDNGFTYAVIKTHAFYVRLVRNAQSNSPSIFTITPAVGAATGSQVVSSAITVTGLTGTAPISITNGEYQVNGGAWTSLAGTVKNGDVVVVRVTASTQPNTTVRSTLTIGSRSGSFTVTTAAAVVVPDDGTVTDPNTGLVWMRCAQGQTWSYGTCKGAANFYTFDGANALTNTVAFAGKSDWRLPNIRELLTIVDYTAAYPAVDSTVFPNFSGLFFWSGSPHASNSSLAWRVYFNFGYGNQGNRGERGAVRLVRGGQSVALLNTASPTADYVDGGDGTVTHEPTGLVWQRCLEGQIWSAGSCTATARSLTWNAASVATSSFAGNTDWRTPTIAELLSLVDYTKPSPGPTLNSAMFPSGASLDLWTRTPVALDSNLAWSVYFGYGGGAHDSRSSSYPVRLVRRVQSLASLPPTDINCVLNWAEARVPNLLTPPKGATLTVDTISYRAYAGGVYVGVEGGSNTVLAVGGSLGANVLTVGQLGDFLPTARAAACK